MTGVGRQQVPGPRDLRPALSDGFKAAHRRLTGVGGGEIHQFGRQVQHQAGLHLIRMISLGVDKGLARDVLADLPEPLHHCHEGFCPAIQVT